MLLHQARQRRYRSGATDASGFRVLVLGWYDRQNIGDDSFAEAFRLLFPGRVDIHCSDDVTHIDDSYAAVIVGGGDVVKPYFLDRIREMLRGFNGPCYAVSVGISYPADVSYLDLFEHVLLRSRADLDLAHASSAEPIRQNLAAACDLSWLLPLPRPAALWLALPRKKRIGLCLAQPVFRRNPLLVEKAVLLVRTLAQRFDEVHLLAFNYGPQPHESDHVINAAIKDAVPEAVDVASPDTQTHDGMLAYMQGLDACVCMRYHSAQFCLKARVPFVALYASRKMDNLLRDVGFESYGCRLPTDAHDKPNDMDVDLVLAKVALAQTAPNVLTSPFVFDPATVVARVRLGLSGQKHLLPPPQDTIDDVLTRCTDTLRRLLNAPDDNIEAWLFRRPDARALSDMMTGGVDYETVARAICFAITRHVSPPYVWGMAQNMQSPGFVPTDAISWVWNDHRDKHAAAVPVRPPPGLCVKACVDLTYFMQDDFKEYHRAGWSYCIAGMLPFDASVRRRNAGLLLDTYIDRSFHWGCPTLVAAGVLPYIRPWVGFVHHTFLETHGENNCATLFRNPVFLASLPACRCIIALSHYLAAQLRDALALVGFGDVPVRVLPHPTEIVPPDSCFTMQKLLDNADRKLVTVGAWLRNPYAIYELDLPHDRNPLGLRKAVLQGKAMEACMAPDWLLPLVERLPYIESPDELGKRRLNRAASTTVSDLRRAPSAALPMFGGGEICRARTAANFHVAGLADMLRRQQAQVRVLTQLSNDEYDGLLASNVVFLSLDDASAVNTVQECLVRNTPLIVNRHPAVEEVLGVAYPGFYDTLSQAARILGDVDSIRAIHEYMKSADKSSCALERFQRELQGVLLEVY